jgi:hypothetical protein
MWIQIASPNRMIGEKDQPALAGLQKNDMDFFNDIAAGALQPGTNLATFIAFNVALLLVIFSLIVLLAFSLTANPALVPHVLVLIFLAIGLWGLMIWMIGVVGVVPAEQQQQTAAAAEAEPSSTDKDSKKQS